MALQTFLENKGFLTIPSGIAKGYFGGLTRVAVRAYQKSMGISQTGYVGPITRAALNGDVLVPAAIAAPSTTPSATVVFGAFTRDLEIGMTGDDVKALQVFLNTHGYEVAASGPGSSGNETSRFGGLTRAALVKFQKTNNISPAAGYFGPKTRTIVNGMQ